MKKIIPNCFVVLFVTVFLARQCFALDDGDFQFWGTAGASCDINKDWKVKFDEELRYGDDASELYYHHSDLGFTYGSLAEWIDLGFNYRQVFEKDSAGKWRQENRPHFNVTLKAKVLDISVSNRARLEYRDRENKKDLWRYRHKITAKFPVELTALKLQPYIADEMFIDFDGDDLNRNRLYSGLSLAVSEQLKGDIYYLWQSSESPCDWIDFNVLGIQLKILF